MISVHFQGKPFNITVILVYAPNTTAKDAEVDQFFEDLKEALELTLKKKKRKGKDVLFIIKNWNAKGGNQEISRIIGKFGLEVQNEAGPTLAVLSGEYAGHRKHQFITTQDTTLSMDISRWSIRKSD